MSHFAAAKVMCGHQVARYRLSQMGPHFFNIKKSDHINENNKLFYLLNEI